LTKEDGAWQEVPNSKLRDSLLGDGICVMVHGKARKLAVLALDSDFFV
jgi:hypothetical protein